MWLSDIDTEHNTRQIEILTASIDRLCERRKKITIAMYKKAMGL